MLRGRIARSRWVSLMMVWAVHCGNGRQVGSASRSPEGEGRAGVTAMQLTSSAFAHQGGIPQRYTCQGEDSRLPWPGPTCPPGPRAWPWSWTTLMRQIPAAPQRTWVHWVLYNIPPAATGLAENVSELPPGTVQGLNDWQRTGYGGPCPPVGRHRYVHRLYALDALLAVNPGLAKADLERAMEGHLLGRCELIGTYEKKTN